MTPENQCYSPKGVVALLLPSKITGGEEVCGQIAEYVDLIYITCPQIN